MGRGPRPGWGLGASRRRGPGRSQGRVHSPPRFPTSHCSQRNTPPHTPGTAPSQASAALAGLKAPGELSSRGRAVPGIMAPVGTQPLGQPPGTASSQRSRGRALAERRGPSAPPEACSSPTHPRGRYRPGRRPQSRGLPTPVSGSPGSLMGKLRPRGLRSQSRASAETEGSVSSFHHRGR